MAEALLPPPGAGAYVVSDRQVEVETPEHVAVGYELADLGSRFTALLLDSLFLFLAQLFVMFALAALGVIAGLGAEFLSGVGLGLAIFAGFVVSWGYFVFFEGYRDGQTPGKRRMGIRVVQDGGYPVTFRAAAVRNLVRIVDSLPPPSFGVAGLTMMLHPRTKRLGDIAAGTVVVRDRTGEPIPEERASDAPSSLGPPKLSDEEYSALSMYVDRRKSLDPPVRARLAQTLYARVAERFSEDPRLAGTSPDAFLVLACGEEAARRRAAGAGGRAGTAQAAALFRRQKPQWQEYERLLAEAKREGLDRLGEARVSRFAAMYREVAADLARARTYGASPELLFALERAVGAGHNLLYRPPTRPWTRVFAWIGGGFPALVRKRWKPIAAASVLFYLPAVLCFAAVRANPALAREMMPAEMIARAEEARSKEAAGEGYVEMPEVLMPAMATHIISNNVQVTFMAFAGGILAGLGTVLILVFNGIHIGGAFGLFDSYGAGLHLWTFAAPHGAIELTAICIAGGAGLWMGSGMILPGRMTRREATVVRGREAVSLIGGTAVMLLVAGMIEGFISPSSLPREVKFTLAAIFAAVLVAWLLLAGRSEGARKAADAAAAR